MGDEETEKTTVHYGIWIQGKGWQRGKDNNAIAFEDKDISDFYAAWFKGSAFPIDDSLVDLQEELIKAEKENEKPEKSLWHTFINFLPKRN